MILSRMMLLSTPNILMKQNYFSAGPNQFGEGGLNGPYQQWPNGDAFLPEFKPPWVGTVQPDIWAQWASQFNHTAAVKSDGSLWISGSNAFGQLALGDKTNRRSMTRIGTANNWIKVGVGTEFTAALNSLGEVWTAGRNDVAAQLHDGTTTGERTTLYNTNNTPEPFNPPSPNWKDLYVGHRYVLVKDANGELWSWGNNGSRQLGRASPGAVANPTQDTYCLRIDIDGPWSKVSPGGYHAAAIHAVTGELWSWGLYSSGQRGPGVTSQLPAIIPCNDPTMQWVDVYSGEYYMHLLRSDGTLWACGTNASGQLGIGNTTGTSTLTQVPGTWKYVQGGYDHTFGIALDGTLWGWGSNQNRKLGNAALTQSQYSSPQQISTKTTWNAAYPNQYGSIATQIVPG